MEQQNDLQEIKRLIVSGEIVNTSKVKLERYMSLLCSREAYNVLGDKEYPQICETVRLLLFTKYINETNTLLGENNTVLKEHTILTKKLHCITVVLAVLTGVLLIITLVQLYKIFCP
jgi:hypothetical protein